MFGSNKLFNRLIKSKNESVRIVKGPCMGRCQHAPTVCVGKNYVDNANFESVIKLIENKDYKPKIPNYVNFENYKLNKGYDLYNKLINNKISLDEIKNSVKESGLKGKGGAGFPTFKKWEFVK